MVKHCTGGRTQRSPRNRRATVESSRRHPRVWQSRGYGVPYASRHAGMRQFTTAPQALFTSKFPGGAATGGPGLAINFHARGGDGHQTAADAPCGGHVFLSVIVYAVRAFRKVTRVLPICQKNPIAPSCRQKFLHLAKGHVLLPGSFAARPGRPGKPARQEGRGFPRTACRHHPIVGRSTRPALHRPQVDRPPVRHPPEPVDRNDGLPHRPAGPWR